VKLPITNKGESLVKTAIGSDFAGTPGVDVPTDQWRNSGTEALFLENGHGSLAVRWRVRGCGKCSMHQPHPYPFPGTGEGGGDTWLMPAGGSAFVDFFFDPYQFNDAEGYATVEWFDAAGSPLNPATLGGSVKVAIQRALVLP
jgi:hypothetical protein